MNRIGVFKGVAVGLAAVLLVLLGLHLWIRSVESRKWAAMGQMTRDLEAAARARSPVRPVLRGSPQPGNAFDFYQRALEQLSSKHLLVPIWSYLREESPENRIRAQEFLDRETEVLAIFREATARGEASHPIDWAARTILWHSGQSVSAIVRCKSRLLWEEGRRREACDLLLDLIQMGQDLERNGEAYGAWGRMVQDPAFDDLVKRVLSADLGREELTEISRELGVLDDSYPEFGDLLVNSAMRLGFTILNAETLDRFMEQIEFKDKRPVAWRNGFSERLMMVEVFERELSDCRRIALGDRRPWAEARTVTESIDRERESYRGALSKRISGDPILPYQRMFRESRAQRRLLRMLAHYRGTGTVLTLQDPLGTTLLSRMEKARVRFWSVGADGVDDGGSGAWKPGEGKDIVLEVKR